MPGEFLRVSIISSRDIALDTFPYNGVTTSFEAIWMGAPILTMKGFNFNSRCGESINYNIGLPELIAKNEDDYILTDNLMLQIIESDRLLEDNKKLALSLHRRKPYMDPLNYIQVMKI